jgi:tetratricopeptide (TPR) repeat protein
MKHNTLTPIFVCVLAGISSAAHAQLIDEIEFRQEGANAVAQIKFVTSVQYLKSISARASDLVQVFYAVRRTQDQISEVAAERRVPAAGGIPSIIFTDEADSSSVQSGINRRLVIRFDTPVRFRVRAGRGDRSIELVLEGLGNSVKLTSLSVPPSASAAIAPAGGRYVLTLQSEQQPGKLLLASVPASLQAYQVFTATRVKDGRTFYDTNLGYFSTREEAAAALDLAGKRFPGAVIAEAQPSVASTPAGAPPVIAAKPPESGLGAAQIPAASPIRNSLEVDASAALLLTAAQSSFDGGNYFGAIESLNQLLNLPPNGSSRRAQELAGLSRLNSGDSAKAAGEFDLFLKLYPTGADSDRVRQLVAALPTMLPPAATAKAAVAATSTTSGSISAFYYGGKSDVRTQEFKDSVLSGLPILQSENTLSSQDQSQLQTNLDLNWRFRDAEKDMRFVFRDAYSADLLPKGINKERLTALYFDYRSLTNGTSFRVGRQSPNGGGVLYRFDGITAGYAFKPKWKLNAVVGTPTDPLLDTRRTFYGLSLDAEALTKEISGSIYIVEQVIDGETDRRALGIDLRYFSGGLSATGQFDYDQILNAVNIASVQATWQATEATVFNAQVDRRTTPILSLGNVLFFQDPSLLAPARRIQELLGTTPIETLREQVKGLTAYQTQARIGGTTALSPNWQTGADFSVTNVDEIKPVALLLPSGQPSTGNLWSVGAQLIGTNLYSARDTHVFNVSLLGGPTYKGALLSYNNLSSFGEKWQLEPSLKYYTQTDDAGASNKTWTVGARAVYRIRQQVSLESELTYEQAEAVGASSGGQANATSSARYNYYFGGRYDF